MKAYENITKSWIDLSQSHCFRKCFSWLFGKNTLALSQHEFRHLQLTTQKIAECNHSFFAQLRAK